MLDPCENCKEKTVDEYGLYCDIFCGGASAYANHQSGVREVVEWIDEHWISKSFHQDGTYEVLISEWEVAKKEWGIC